MVNTTLQSNHSILMPTDSSPRLLELLVLLDQHWSFKLTKPHGITPALDTWPYPLCLVSRTGQDMVNFARSLIEWMGGVIRDSGGAEVDGRKKRKGVGALGSDYGALDFRFVGLSGSC
jgi:cleavage and polyadenylation specificity factor subunit 2